MSCKRFNSKYLSNLTLPALLMVGLAVAMGASISEINMAHAGNSPGSDPPLCLAASGQTAVDVCKRELTQHPQNIDIRIALSEALINLERYREAVAVLNKGLELHPSNKSIQEKAALAESFYKEQLWIEKQRTGGKVSGGESKVQLDVKTRLNIIRCSQLKGEAALTACNESLKKLPNDPDLYRGKGDALIDMNRIGEAVVAYQDSLRLAPANRETSQKLIRVRSKRRVSAAKCLQGDGPGALEDCNAALMIGAPDELALQKRRGELLRDMGRTDEASAAFAAALKLDPTDAAVAGNLTALKGENISVRSPSSPESPRASGTDHARNPALTSLSAADFGRYHALVIGNNDYKFLHDLKTAINDAEAIAQLLQEKYHFKVDLLKDATEADIIGALTDLRRDLRATDNLIIYYAGHGIIDNVTRRGYWLPVDADQENRASWISNEDITNELKAMRPKHVLVVADSCYSGTLARDAGSVNMRVGGISEWVVRMSKKRSRTVLSSGGIEPVLDWDGAKHSVFSRAFLMTLRENDQIIDMDSLFEPLKRRVVLNAEQTPIYSDIRFANHEEGDFIFVPGNRSIPLK